MGMSCELVAFNLSDVSEHIRTVPNKFGTRTVNGIEQKYPARYLTHDVDYRLEIEVGNFRKNYIAKTMLAQAAALDKQATHCLIEKVDLELMLAKVNELLSLPQEELTGIQECYMNDYKNIKTELERCLGTVDFDKQIVTLMWT